MRDRLTCIYLLYMLLIAPTLQVIARFCKVDKVEVNFVSVKSALISNSFLAIGDFCRLLIPFANSLDLIQVLSGSSLFANKLSLVNIVSKYIQQTTKQMAFSGTI